STPCQLCVNARVTSARRAPDLITGPLFTKSPAALTVEDWMTPARHRPAGWDADAGQGEAGGHDRQDLNSNCVSAVSIRVSSVSDWAGGAARGALSGRLL